MKRITIKASDLAGGDPSGEQPEKYTGNFEPKEGDISPTWKLTKDGILAIDGENHFDNGFKLVKVPDGMTRAVISATGSLNDVEKAYFYPSISTFVISVGGKVHARSQSFRRMVDAGLSGFRCTEEGCALFFG